MPHRALVFPAKNQRTFPETEDAVPLERRHETNDSFVFEKRRLPLDRFFDIRTADVHDFAQMFQDRPGKWRGALKCNRRLADLFWPSELFGFAWVLRRRRSCISKPAFTNQHQIADVDD